MRWLLPLLVVPLASGCLTGGGGAGECIEEPERLEWSEPALYDALPAKGEVSGFAFASRDLSGLPPLARTDLKAQWREPHVLAVSRGLNAEEPWDGDWAVRLSLEGEPMIRVQWPAPADADAVRRVFVGFAANVTSVDNETRDAWADGLLRAREAVEIDGRALDAFTVAVEAPLRLTARYAELAELSAPTLTSQALGHAQVRFNEWVFDLALPTRSGERGDGNATLRLEADAAGNVRFAREAAVPIGETAMRHAVQGRLRDLDLEAPSIAEATYGAMGEC